jgi:hypothetical protein
MRHQRPLSTYSADCRAKHLCQENTSVEMTLLVTTFEEIMQSLVKELVKTKSRYDAASSDQESLSRESINAALANTSVDHSTSSKDKQTKTASQSKRLPPPSGRALRHAVPEIDQLPEYIASVASALHRAIEAKDGKMIKSYRRSLKAAIPRMREVVTPTVQAQRWDPSLVEEFMQDVDGSTSDMLRSANVTLMHLDQKALTIRANSCMEQGRQVSIWQAKPTSC